MTTVHLSPTQLNAVLQSHATKLPKAIQDGLLMAAHRGRALLVQKSPVDQGVYKNSWAVRERGADGPTIDNDAPHAGIIEGGARPHLVSREGIEALTAWVKRHISKPKKGRRGRGKVSTKQYGPKLPRAYGPTAPRMYGPKLPATYGPRLPNPDAWARSIAFAIAAKLKAEGQKGLFIVRDNLPTLSKYMQQEVARQINKALAGK